METNNEIVLNDYGILEYNISPALLKKVPEFSVKLLFYL